MESIWSQTCSLPERPPLAEDRHTEIAVIGAGMAGVLIASLLQEAGHEVLVLEASRTASGQTQNTTAKITSQHGLFCRRLIRDLGEERAKRYAMANEAAVREYRRMIAAKGIDCDFEERSAYLYGSDLPLLESETAAARRLGLPASLARKIDSLPFPAEGAVRFTGQAQFHPLKFLRAVADELEICEHTPVQTVEGNAVRTARGTVTAEKIVFATHYPFINFPGMYFARMHQERSYVLALENAAQVDGMWLGADENGYSFRNYGGLLLLGGGGHRTGENREGGRYEELRMKARTWFPSSREVACWSAQDCITADDAPYIGRYAEGRPNWFVATGFRKWGMTHSMVSAMLLRDLIEGTESPYAAAFDPGRFDLKTVEGVAEEAGHAVKGLAKQLFQLPKEAAAHVPPGHGGVVTHRGETLGVYKDEVGTLWTVDLRCRHLGCRLEWNPDEQSWDCPCHGSRYDRRGRLISGPAQEDLKRGDVCPS